jgi:chromosome segregation ATPase
MIFTVKHKMIAAAAAIVLLMTIANSIGSYVRLERLERSVGQAKRAAENVRERSDEIEIQTHIHKEKARHLEDQVIELRNEAREQDEKLEKLSADTDDARRALKRVRGGSK